MVKKEKTPIVLEKFNSFRKTEVINMMEVFYSSDAVSTNGSPEIFERDFEECLKGIVLLGYVIKKDQEIIGYTMLSKGFCTEWGKPLIFIEDIYIKPEHRYHGYSRYVFDFILNEFKDHVFKLEVELENESAINCYKRTGFEVLPYSIMVKK